MTHTSPGHHVTVPPPPRARDEGPPGPPAAARWDVPWGVLDAVGVLVLAVLATIGTVVAVTALMPAEPPGWLRGAVLPLPLVLLALTALAWVHVRHRAVGRLVGPVRARARDWLLGLLWGFGAFLAVNVVLGLLLQALAAVAGVELPEPQEELRRAVLDPALLPWMIVSTVVVAPLAEELYFRGMLFQALRRRQRAWWAIGLSAAAFAVAHIAQEATGPAGFLVFVLILPMGLLLGWVFERRGTLATPVAAHAAFNLTTLGILVAAASQSLVAAPLA